MASKAKAGTSSENERKCHRKECRKNKRKDCDNNMCKKCCENCGKACAAHGVHKDAFDVYAPPSYESSEEFHKVQPSAHLENRKKFEEVISVKKPLRRLTFGSDFSVMDDDLTKVVDLWGDQLVVLELGSSDSGCGSYLTDTSVQHLASHCPNLRKLRLESATRVTDKAMIDIMTKCPLLEELHVSGNDKSSGKLTDKTMKLLFEKDVLPNLKQICVTDQIAIKHNTVYRLRSKRHRLRIIAGETDSDSFAHSMVLSMMGMDYGDGLF
ncbi:uncharacterized protein LOC116298524 [Actinia tenebrosa]|uniref:Uncharacterized protein LOC116298524 n=1 Tax=Actinia tenebrosa TaxID=6105 RepID=A0A6P8I6C2_ACTTE|nr:uncharacterized protein LOC116298524 [Actinia tenebrosa]